MPGTRARRAREYRARARSLELIAQRPTPANCVEHGDWRPSSWRLSPSGRQRDRHRRRRRSQSPGFTFHVLPFTVPVSERQKLLNPSAYLVEPLSCLEICKEIGQVAPHSLAVPIHHGQIGSDVRREIDLVDDK